MKLNHNALAATVLATALALPATSLANPYDGLGCHALWVQRNQIYADAGYCFKTADARSVWGSNCFPPYGRLTSGAQHQVELIIAVERQQGC